MALTPYFQHLPDIVYEGPESDNPLAYKYYNPQEKIGGKTMADWLRFAVCYWHTFCGNGGDPFGAGTIVRPWEEGREGLDLALHKAEVVFDFIAKLGLNFYCFHDRDVAPEGRSVAQTNKHLWAVAKRFKQLQKATGIRLLWGTANMFSHPRFNQGASTTPNADVFAYCANSVKEMLDVTLFLGGENYVFWGGREGYNSLLNTDMGRELKHLARFLRMAVDYAKEIGFTGQFLIEPKPCEPTKHQYDFDAANSLCFLKTHKLDKHFAFNIEANHATLAHHAFCHELEWCRVNGKLGSIDANRGDLLLGWDTDQFPNDVAECTQAMLIIMKQKGLAPGGLNFDAKLRRDSTDLEDLFHAHIGAVDVWAKALRIADRIRRDGHFDQAVSQRYSSYDSGIGKDIERGATDFKALQRYIIKKGEAAPTDSARQEYLENLFNRYC